MKGDYVTIHLHDEYPVIGAGLRRFVMWEGRTWVYLYYPPRWLTIRMTPKRFAELKARPVPSDDWKPPVVVAQIESGIKNSYGNVSQAKRALSVLAEKVVTVKVEPAEVPVLKAAVAATSKRRAIPKSKSRATRSKVAMPKERRPQRQVKKSRLS